MRGLGILILVVIFFWLVWPAVSRWLKRKAAERAEDYLRASMGMPPRDRKNRNSKRDSEGYGNSSYQRARRNPFESSSRSKEPLIPKEYAEDVEFVETKDYSATETHKDSTKTQTYHESQISDAEWTEIKNPRSK